MMGSTNLTLIPCLELLLTLPAPVLLTDHSVMLILAFPTLVFLCLTFNVIMLIVCPLQPVAIVLAVAVLVCTKFGIGDLVILIMRLLNM